jgi:N-acetyl-anhydromuramyl-L-alanine amidase AmpD
MKIIDGWLDEAIKIDCSENSSSRNGRKIKFVVQHGTAGGSSAENIGNFYRGTIGGNNPVSTHFVIGKDGHIVQCVSMLQSAWANGIIGTGHASFIPDGINPNEYTASIEYVKNQVDARGIPDNSDQLTEAQKFAGFKLNKCICETYGVPKRAGDINGGIIGHKDINPVDRSRCPGAFPWQECFDYLNGGNKPMPQVPSGWSDNGTVLTAPNGVPVRGGFRDHILADPTWHKDNWPLKPEYQAKFVEQSNTALGAGAAQEFRWKRLSWCQSLGIYEGWLGLELYWYQKAFDQAQAALVQLKAENANLKEQLNANTQAQQIIALEAKIALAVKDLQL